MSVINTEEEVFNIAEQILSGAIDLDDLPIDNYEDVGFTFWKLVQEVFGVNLDDVDPNDPLFEIMTAYKENVYHTAAAKTFQMVKDGKKLAFDVNGVKKTIDVFAPQFKGIEGLYNGAWLEVEVDLVRKMSESASLWNDIQLDKELFPLLKYVTVGDDRVRDEHVLLDGIVLPTNHAFWTSHFPPNGWRCRCTAEQLQEGQEPITTVTMDLKKVIAKEVEALEPLFNFNPGIELKIFRLSHPYFAVGNKYQHLKNSNFRLKIPDTNK